MPATLNQQIDNILSGRVAKTAIYLRNAIEIFGSISVSEPLSKAVLDACVLFKATLRDTLLRAAEAKLYEVYWSETILDEVSRNLVATGRTSSEQAERLLAAMRQFFSEATVTGFEDLIPSMTNDEKDRHVLAVAVKIRVDAIVTSNLKDFPDRALAPYEIDAVSPDEFLVYLFGKFPEAMTRIVAQQATQLRRPPIAVKEILDVLAADAPEFVGLVRPRLNDSEQ